MKAPPKLQDNLSRVGRGHCFLTSGLGDGLKEVKTYGVTVEGRTSTCYALVHPGEIIAPKFHFNDQIVEFADLVVDGILRGSCQSHSVYNEFKGTMEKALYQFPSQNGSRVGGIKYCHMKVKVRDTSKDVPFNGQGEPSSVGTLKVQIFQKHTTVKKEQGNQDEAGHEQANNDEDLEELGTNGIADRAPAYDKYPKWSDLNCSISNERSPPPFEIEFVDPKKGHSTVRDRVLKTRAGRYLVGATFIWHLCSEVELKALGVFDHPASDDFSPRSGTPANQTPNDSSSWNELENEEDTMMSSGGLSHDDRLEQDKSGTLLDTPSKLTKSSSLQGLRSASAHQTYLTRGSTQDTDSRSTTAGQDDYMQPNPRIDPVMSKYPSQSQPTIASQRNPSYTDPQNSQGPFEPAFNGKGSLSVRGRPVIEGAVSQFLSHNDTRSQRVHNGQGSRAQLSATSSPSVPGPPSNPRQSIRRAPHGGSSVLSQSVDGHVQGAAESRPGPFLQRSLEAQTRKRTAARAASGSLSTPEPAAKRDSDFISGGISQDNSPRKSLGSPALKKTRDLEREKAEAKERIAAAQEKKKRLEKEYQAALVVKAERDKADDLIRKAEQLESENEILQAKINAAIYGDEDEVSGMN